MAHEHDKFEIKVTPLTDKISEEEQQFYKDESIRICRLYPGTSIVHPVVMVNPDTKERIVAYLKEPNFETKVRVMDKSITIGFYSAANELMDSTLIKDQSHPLSYGESNECDRYKMCVVEECLLLVKRLQNQFKKN